MATAEVAEMAPPTYPVPVMPERRRAAFERLEATLLACPKCRRAVQVRKRLLLILPEGDKYEYVCPHCGSTCGSTVQKDTAPHRLM